MTPLNAATATWTVPGKVMIVGEYDVLQGGPCLAVCIDRFLTLTCHLRPFSSCSSLHPPQSKPQFTFKSALWDQPKIFADAPALASSGEWFCKAMYQALCEYTQALEGPMEGLCMEASVDSDLHPSFGLGSSSALALACFKVVQLIYAPTQPEEALHRARQVWQLQTLHQGYASGYDALTQSLGGWVLWKRPLFTPASAWPGKTERLSLEQTAFLGPHLQVWVGGGGAQTAQTIHAQLPYIDIPRLREASQRLLHALLISRSLGLISQAMGQHRRCFEATPVYPRLLSLLSDLPGCDLEWSFKTTGAGGEDALLLWGQSLEAPGQVLTSQGWHRLRVQWGVETGAVV